MNMVLSEIIQSTNWLLSQSNLSDEIVCEIMKIRDNAKMLKENEYNKN